VSRYSRHACSGVGVVDHSLHSGGGGGAAKLRWRPCGPTAAKCKLVTGIRHSCHSVRTVPLIVKY
jgi:hypothetical protein